MTEFADNEARKPVLLVVEEEYGVRYLLELALGRQGFQVLTAESGYEAVDIYEREADNIDLVLMDVRMEGLSGPETLTKLREINPAVRCCLMTGDTALSKADEMYAGHDVLHIFRKPFVSLIEFGNELRKYVKP
jgi:CheY-like chemotaxis protein